MTQFTRLVPTLEALPPFVLPYDKELHMTGDKRKGEARRPCPNLEHAARLTQPRPHRRDLEPAT